MKFHFAKPTIKDEPHDNATNITESARPLLTPSNNNINDVLAVLYTALQPFPDAVAALDRTLTKLLGHDYNFALRQAAGVRQVP